MSRKTRRTTRLINLDLPYRLWPENHNNRVQSRKQIRRLNRQFRGLTLATRRVVRAMDAFAQAFALVPPTLPSTGNQEGTQP